MKPSPHQNQNKQHIARDLLRRPKNVTSGSSLLQESDIGDHLADHEFFSIRYKARSNRHLAPFRGYSYDILSPYIVQTEKGI